MEVIQLPMGDRRTGGKRVLKRKRERVSRKRRDEAGHSDSPEKENIS